MKFRLYIGNLSKLTLPNELNSLFTQAGMVLSAEVVRSQENGESSGFGFVTMSTQNEADKAVNMFNLYLLDGHTLSVSLADSMKNRDVNFPHMEA